MPRYHLYEIVRIVKVVSTVKLVIIFDDAITPLHIIKLSCETKQCNGNAI